MIVVADTSPLNYLIQIDCDSLLLQLYKRVFVPPAVLDELNDAVAPAAVNEWLAHLPRWIEVRSIASEPDVTLSFLDRGERDAIQLAEELRADFLLIDERKGRLEAKRRGLIITGTLGVLLAAGESGLVDAKTAYRRLLDQTTFRVSPELDAEFSARLRREL